MLPLLDHLWRILETHRARVERCLDRLPPEAVWRPPGAGLNSVGHLCLHLAGNESHYLGHGVGGFPYERDRRREFTETEEIPPHELRRRLAEARELTRRTFERLGEEDLSRRVDVDYPSDPTGLGVVLHVVEHWSWHAGQIVLITRLARGDGGRLLEWDH